MKDCTILQKCKERQTEASARSSWEDSRVSSIRELLELQSMSQQKKTGFTADPAKTKSIDTN